PHPADLRRHPPDADDDRRARDRDVRRDAGGAELHAGAERVGAVHAESVADGAAGNPGGGVEPGDRRPRVGRDPGRIGLGGGGLVLDGGMTKGVLIMFLTYLVMLLGPLEALASSATQLQNSLAGLDRVLNLLAEPREMPDRPGARVIDPLAPAGRIEVRHVG